MRGWEGWTNNLEGPVARVGRAAYSLSMAEAERLASGAGLSGRRRKVEEPELTAEITETGGRRTVVAVFFAVPGRYSNRTTKTLGMCMPGWEAGGAGWLCSNGVPPSGPSHLALL